MPIREPCAAVPKQPDLVVDGLARLGEVLREAVARSSEERADQPIVQVEDLVGQCGHRLERDRHQRRVPTVGLVLHDPIDGGLRPFPGQSQQAVLVDLVADRGGQAERPNRLQSLDVTHDVPGPGRLPYPGQRADRASGRHDEQTVEPLPMLGAQRIGQQTKDLALRARGRLRTQQLEHPYRRQHDPSCPQLRYQCLGDHEPLRGLHRQGHQPRHQIAPVRATEGLETEPREHLEHVLTSGLVADRVVIPEPGRQIQLRRDDTEHRDVRDLSCRERPAGKAQVAQLNGDTEPIVLAAMGTHERQIVGRERAQPDELALVVGERQQVVALRRRQQLFRRGTTGSQKRWFARRVERVVTGHTIMRFSGSRKPLSK